MVINNDRSSYVGRHPQACPSQQHNVVPVASVIDKASVVSVHQTRSGQHQRTDHLNPVETNQEPQWKHNLTMSNNNEKQLTKPPAKC